LPYPLDDPERPSQGPPVDDRLSVERPRTLVRPRKFQNRLWWHVLLLFGTLAFTTIVGAEYYGSYASDFRQTSVRLQAPLIVYGFWYSLTLLAILGAHEMGHYVFCRRYNIDASLPYFIPAPLPMTGTLGAVIKIREPFPTRRVLFDIGVGGPIAGFVVLVPALVIGMSMSRVIPIPKGIPLLFAGEPLLFQWVAALFFGDLPAGHTLNCHPMVWAAWFGMLATALNLLPFGQLDGGHITYASLGRWSAPISIATVGVAILLTYNSSSWLFMTVMMLVMLLLLGPRHPRVIYEYEPLPPSRYVIAVIALVIFILCFTPVPIDTFLQQPPS
jgi:membrane-associated protease RseP (regulator of RpoE activity)